MKDLLKKMGGSILLLTLPLLGFSQTEPTKKIHIKVEKDGKTTEMVLEGTHEEIEKALRNGPNENEEILAFLEQNVVLELDGEGVQRFSLDKKRPMLGITYLVKNGVVEVEKVIEAGAAEEMGIVAGDQIFSINGQKITSEKQLKSEIAKNGIDSEIEITIVRDGKKQTYKGKLKSIDLQMREEVLLSRAPRGIEVPENIMFYHEVMSKRDHKVFDEILKDKDYSELSAEVSIKELNGDNFLFTASSLEEKEVHLTIYDAHGKLIFKEKYDGSHEMAKTFELKDVVPGFYYAIIEQNGALKKEKFMVK